MENFQKTNVHYYKTFNGWNGHKLCFSIPEVGFDIKPEMIFAAGSTLRALNTFSVDISNLNIASANLKRILVVSQHLQRFLSCKKRLSRSLE